MADVTGACRPSCRQAPKELHLVGHSLGGLIAYRFLERFPEQAAGSGGVSPARLRWQAVRHAT